MIYTLATHSLHRRTTKGLAGQREEDKSGRPYTLRPPETALGCRRLKLL